MEEDEKQNEAGKVSEPAKVQEDQMIEEIQEGTGKQPLIETNNSNEEIAEEDFYNGLTDIEKELFNKANLENLKIHQAEATKLRIEKKFDEACTILLILVKKIEKLKNDPFEPALGPLYFMIGNC